MLSHSTLLPSYRFVPSSVIALSSFFVIPLSSFFVIALRSFSVIALRSFFVIALSSFSVIPLSSFFVIPAKAGIQEDPGKREDSSNIMRYNI